MDKISIEKFSEKYVQYKVDLINNRDNNRYLHYQLPLEYDNTLEWYNKNMNNTKRYDAVILNNDLPVGILGLLNIEENQAEYYITLGIRGNNIGVIATEKLLQIAKKEYNLSKIYLTTETENKRAHRFFEKVGFKFVKKVNGKEFLTSSDKDRYYFEIVINKED